MQIDVSANTPTTSQAVFVDNLSDGWELLQTFEQD